MASSQLARNVRRVGKGYLNRPAPKNPTNYCGLIHDPAIEKWNKMRETTTVHFKWTFKTVALAVFWVGAVPLSLYNLVVHDVTKHYLIDGKEKPHFFPDAVMTNRKIDPLPPRKPGIKI